MTSPPLDGRAGSHGGSKSGSTILDGRVYITGSPGSRDWYANLLANPAFTFHLKEGVRADLAARATPIVDDEARRAILAPIPQKIGYLRDLEAWVARSPLVEVTFSEVTFSEKSLA